MSDTVSDQSSRAQAREEVAEPIHRAMCNDSWEDCVEWEGRCHRAAEYVLDDFARLAGLLGYVKADSEEWGYRRVPGFSVGFPYTRDAAQRLADLHPDGTIERRSVGHGPWEVVTDAES